jgi:DNA-binding NarL/FixJ family response regulator
VVSEPLRVNVGVETYHPPDPFGDAGLTAIVVAGLTVSSLMCVVFAASVLPALSTDQYSTAIVTSTAAGEPPTLTPREREVLKLLAEGMTNDGAAAALSISPETIQTHVRKAMTKLDADTRTAAVATALRLALIA